MEKLRIIHPRDNVAIAIEPIEAQQTIVLNGVPLTAAERIEAGHKIALQDIAKDQKIIKYGYPIGAAKTTIMKGMHVHTDNVRSMLTDHITYAYNEDQAAYFIRTADILKSSYEGKVPTIQAYVRLDGRIGIRNELWIVPTVGCVNHIGEILAAWAQDNITSNSKLDGIHCWSHPYGCSQLGEDLEATRLILADLVHHPNAGGVLVLSLGCENNTPASFRELVGEVDPKRVKFLVCQSVEDELVEGRRLLLEIANAMQFDKREPVSMARLIVGLKCGASDAFSAITANPLVGQFCDALIAMGGTAVLTEVPEMFGAEHLLMNRARNRNVFKKIVNLIQDFKDYYIKHGQAVYENPSPGNKAGGISTLEEKSLGSVQKGGRAVIEDVLPYGALVSKAGLNLLSSPGNDIVSTTALAAAGCHMILFTTGLGTPLGAPVPTVKISSNTNLASRKPDWIDFDSGRLLVEGSELLNAQLADMVQSVASGMYLTKNELNGYAEISIFKDGVIL